MTDNRTTELREKLTERGIEYTTNDHMGVCETSWNGFTAMQLTPGAKLLMVFTPDQAIAATVGNGTLTAEQVRECVQHVYHEGYSDGSVRRGAHIDETDWQAIADELNAELGSGTCENVFDEPQHFQCSECTKRGNVRKMFVNGDPLVFCPDCGARILKAVKR